ncbi:MAG: Rpn family recombination-promoting nuclease/putative transposase [Oscillospiraceae bacterium]|nr:Rpn family recombination-promoting nuclease/putative transposase [Oscillospiraceae bacterium]
MDRNAKIVKLKLDIIFKRVFGDARNDEIIKAFIEDLLEMKRGTIEEIIIENVELPPGELDKKFSRLDLKMKVNNQTVNIELQVKPENDFGDRTLFYWAKIFTEELGSGEEYGDLRKTICINIINFNPFSCKEYHSHFQVLEKNRHEVLSDKFDIHFFELRKIKKAPQNKPMEDWLNLINAETEGELMDIETTTQIQEVKSAIVVLRELNADDKVRQEAYYREKRLHDEATALGYARREGEVAGLKKGKAEGIVEGTINTLIDLVKKGLLTLPQAAEQAKMSVSEFETKAGLR